MNESFVLFYGEAIKKADQELGVKDPQSVPMKMLILRHAVICVRESFGDELEEDGSIIYLQSGESFWVEDDMTTAAKKLSIQTNEGVASK